MIIELHLEASAELAAAADWYQRNDHLGFAEDFLESIDKALEQIAEMPHTWPRCHGVSSELPPLHRFVVRKLPYVIVYMVRRAGIVVVAVAHTSRQPLYWLDRASTAVGAKSRSHPASGSSPQMSAASGRDRLFSHHGGWCACYLPARAAGE